MISLFGGDTQERLFIKMILEVNCKGHVTVLLGRGRTDTLHTIRGGIQPVTLEPHVAQDGYE